MSGAGTREQTLHEELLALRARVAELEATVDAIRSGQVDALVVNVRGRPHVYTLETGDRPYRTMVEQMQEGAATLSEDGLVLYCNRRFAELLGRPLEEVIGQPLERFVRLQHEERLRELLAQAAEAPAAGEVELGRADGKHVPLSLSLKALRLDEDDEVGICVVASDLTERRQAEQKIRRLNRDLELRIDERTAELAEANEQLTSFAYSISHDLRAPLRALTGFAGILAEEFPQELPQDARKYVGFVHDQAQRLDRMVSGLLALSRIGRQPVQRRPVDPGELVRRAIEELQDETRDRDVRFEVGPLPTVEGDPELLSIVFSDLLDNALKFTRPKPEALIEVGCEPGGDAPVFYVRDNGVGFDMRFVDKLFAPFQRLHPETDFAGTGIGLATVQRIVERHGGRIWAEAAPGAGASFRFVLAEPEAAETG